MYSHKGGLNQGHGHGQRRQMYATIWSTMEAVSQALAISGVIAWRHSRIAFAISVAEAAG